MIMNGIKRFALVVALSFCGRGAAAAVAKDASFCHPGKDPPAALSITQAGSSGTVSEPLGAGSDRPGGLHASPHGLTPLTLAGTTTVSVAEARCLIETLGETMVVVSVIGGSEQLPGFVDALGGEIGVEDTTADEKIKQVLAKATGGDKTRPLLFYCASVECYMSYNAAIRAVRLGYSRIYWMRAGLQGWQEARYPLDLTNMYREFVEHSGIGAEIDDQMTQALKAIGDELTKIHADGKFTEAEQARFGRIFVEEFGAWNELKKFDSAETLRYRILDRFVRAEAPTFSYDEIRGLQESWSSQGNEDFYKARYKAPVDVDGLWGQAEQAIIAWYSRPVEDSNSDIFVDPYIDTGTQLAINLLCNEGTCESVVSRIKVKFQPRIAALMEQRYGKRDSLPAESRERMDSITSEISKRLFRKIMASMAAPLAKLYSTANLADMSTSYPTPAQKKLANLRSSDEGIKRMVWARWEIQQAKSCVISRFLQPENSQ